MASRGSQTDLRTRDRRRALTAVALGVLLVTLSLGASAASAVVVRLGGQTYGVTPIQGAGPEGVIASDRLAGRAVTSPAGVSPLDRLPKGGGALEYHGGPVMHSVTTHLIYWDPNEEFKGATTEIFSKFFTDVAKDSGLAGNVFAIGGQYTDGSGSAAYSSTFGGARIDKAPYPSTGNCIVPTALGADLGPPYTECLFDIQLRAGLSAYISAEKLPTGPTQQYFVLLPHKVVTCFNEIVEEELVCSNNFFCAYHGVIKRGPGEEIIYSDIPFSLLDEGHAKGCQDDGHQTVIQLPNGDRGSSESETRYADVALKYTSHEYMEAATDPLSTAYFDANGSEIGDKCNGVSPDGAKDGIDYDPNSFLPTLGGEAGKGNLFDQSINGDSYYLQSEWDNAAKACRMEPVALTAAAFSASSATTPSTPVSFEGSVTDIYGSPGFTWNFGDGTEGAGGAPSHTYAAAGTYKVTMTARDQLTGATTAPVTHSVAVGKTQSLAFTSTAPASATVGGPAYNVTAEASPSKLPVALTIDPASSSVCGISGSTVSFIGAGKCIIDANQAGNSEYAAASEVKQEFAVIRGAQKITFTSTVPVAATVGGSTYTPTATGGGSGNPVTFTIDATSLPVCSIAGSTVSFNAEGTCKIDANQAGNTQFNAAPQVQQSFPVVRKAQSLAFTSTAPVSAGVGGPAYNATAEALPSKLPVTLTIDAASSAVCKITPPAVSFVGVGKCIIDAKQAGNAEYAAAPEVKQEFAVMKGSQTIRFTSTAPDVATVGGPTYTPTATGGGSGKPVTFTVDTASGSVCAIVGSTVSFKAEGPCKIDANQEASANYNAAPQVVQSFPVSNKKSQAITFTSVAPTSATVGGPTYSVTAEASPSKLPVTLTIAAESGSVCKISTSSVSFVGVGKCVIDANQGGNSSYAPAPQVTQEFEVVVQGSQGNSTPPFTPTLTEQLTTQAPDSNFSMLGPTIDPVSGAITFTASIGNPGTVSWLLTFPNGKFGVLTASVKKCKPGLVRLFGRCRKAGVVFGQGSRSVSALGTVTFTVKPSALAVKALKQALRRKKGLPVTATLAFQSARGGAPVAHTQSLTVKLAKK